MLDILVGGFYGDEGKGKVASYLALKDKPAMAVRTGSINAGHTIVYKGTKYKLRSIPSAFISESTKLVIPPGALVKIDVLFKELADTNSTSRMTIDPHTAVITEKEVQEEVNNDFLANVVGSTKYGVGATESKRILRSLKLAKDYPELSKHLSDVPNAVIDCSEKGGKIQVEGSQGHLLSLYHGEYPFVTSRNTTSSGVLSDVGVGPSYVENIIPIFKAFVTRVGAGPLEGELGEEAEKLGMVEYGTNTGRKRRSAPFNIKIAKEVIKINSANQAAVTKVDVLFKEAAGVKEYDKLPRAAKDWIENIEREIKAPITLIGTGEDAFDMVDRRAELLGK